MTAGRCMLVSMHLFLRSQTRVGPPLPTHSLQHLEPFILLPKRCRRCRRKLRPPSSPRATRSPRRRDRDAFSLAFGQPRPALDPLGMDCIHTIMAFIIVRVRHQRRVSPTLVGFKGSGLRVQSIFSVEYQRFGIDGLGSGVQRLAGLVYRSQSSRALGIATLLHVTV